MRICGFLSQISLVAAINNMRQVYGGRDVIFSQVRYAQLSMAVAGIVICLSVMVIIACTYRELSVD